MMDWIDLRGWRVHWLGLGVAGAALLACGSDDGESDDGSGSSTMTGSAASTTDTSTSTGTSTSATSADASTSATEADSSTSATGADSSSVSGGSDGEGDTGVDLEQLGQHCPDEGCPEGLTRVVYCGIDGCTLREFCSCEIPCEDDPDVCPEGTTCGTISDGPGDVCLRI